MKTREIKNIFPESLRSFISGHRENEYVLLDVRLPQEYVNEHIPGAKHIPLHELEGRLGELGADKKTVFYCRSGKRSMAGAILARDSGLLTGEIFNLEGGISAYTGKTLPNYPKLTIFYASGSVEDVLKKAIALERGAHLFYLGFLDRIKDSKIKKQVGKLADLEVAHARVIYKLGREIFFDQDFDTLFTESEGSELEGGLDARKWMKRIHWDDQNELCMYFFELALEMESMAYDMYRNLAEGNYPKDTVECFFRLSEQEKGHMRLVANIFRECFPGNNGS